MADITPKKLAYAILAAFDKSYRQFCTITRGARKRFVNADWDAVQRAARDRIHSYDQMISEVSLALYYQLDNPALCPALWHATKQNYSSLLHGHPQPELAETFFNSVFSRLYQRQGLDNQHLFIRPEQVSRSGTTTEGLCHRYPLGEITTTTWQRLLGHYHFGCPWQDLTRDIKGIRRQLSPLLAKQQIHHIELLKPVFYRNKGAYLIGRLDGERASPLVIALLRDGDGALRIDAVLTNRDDLSVLFGFARAYFMVDAPTPAPLLAYLKQLMPHKPYSELYGALGLQKHSKTEFYRELLNHLEHSDDQFISAPGIKGMVMTVFTLPSLGIVFKLIKDSFAPPKEITKAQVRDQYQLVKDHDRVGRLADTQEFCHLRLPRERFDPALLDELLTVAPSEITLSDDQVVIRHLYTERRMIPLNLYIDQANRQQLDKIIDEYGRAIKQLAAANIFPGDMLFKNFGVTRHGRVVFYDYDEIWYMTQCRFRAIPESQTYEQEMASEPWYSIGEFDVFPEEFGRFLLGRPEIRQSFMQHHGELLTPAYWQAIQQQCRDGCHADVLPYRHRQRLHRARLENLPQQ